MQVGKLLGRSSRIAFAVHDVPKLLQAGRLPASSRPTAYTSYLAITSSCMWIMRGLYSGLAVYKVLVYLVVLAFESILYHGLVARHLDQKLVASFLCAHLSFYADDSAMQRLDPGAGESL